MASKVKKDNYVVIQGWMVEELKLKGNELIIYAIIYGFSQTEEQRFNGSLQYLADWTNSTKRGVLKNINNLLEKKHIIKYEKIINGVKFCEYYVSKFTGIEQSSIGGIEQSSPNNIDIDKKKERKKPTYDDVINEKINNDEIKELLYEFIKLRKLKNKPLTDRALKIQINKLLKLSDDIEIQKKIIEKTIVKCWDEFYPYKEENTKKHYTSNDNSVNLVEIDNGGFRLKV